MYKHVVLLLLLLLVAVSAEARDRNLVFYKTKPSFKQAVLQVQGFIEDSPESDRLQLPYELLDLNTDVKLQTQDSQRGYPLPNQSDFVKNLAKDANYGVQQRFLGGLFNIFPVARTQTVIQVATRTSVVVPLCVVCTTTAAGNAPAVCAAPGAPLPTTCPSQNRRKRQLLFHDFIKEQIQPSRIKAAEIKPSIQPPSDPNDDQNSSSKNEFLTPLVIHSSMEEPRDSSSAELQQRDSYQFISTSVVTTTVTVTGTVTAQVQVGNLNCLPQYLATVPKCTSVGL